MLEGAFKAVVVQKGAFQLHILVKGKHHPVAVGGEAKEWIGSMHGIVNCMLPKGSPSLLL